MVYAVASPVRWIAGLLQAEGATVNAVAADQEFTRIERIAARAVASPGTKAFTVSVELSVRRSRPPKPSRVSTTRPAAGSATNRPLVAGGAAAPVIQPTMSRWKSDLPVETHPDDGKVRDSQAGLLIERGRVRFPNAVCPHRHETVGGCGDGSEVHGNRRRNGPEIGHIRPPLETRSAALREIAGMPTGM